MNATMAINARPTGITTPQHPSALGEATDSSDSNALTTMRKTRRATPAAADDDGVKGGAKSKTTSKALSKTTSKTSSTTTPTMTTTNKKKSKASSGRSKSKSRDPLSNSSTHSKAKRKSKGSKSSKANGNSKELRRQATSSTAPTCDEVSFGEGDVDLDSYSFFDGDVASHASDICSQIISLEGSVSLQPSTDGAPNEMIITHVTCATDNEPVAQRKKSRKKDKKTSKTKSRSSKDRKNKDGTTSTTKSSKKTGSTSKSKSKSKKSKKKSKSGNVRELVQSIERKFSDDCDDEATTVTTSTTTSPQDASACDGEDSIYFSESESESSSVWTTIMEDADDADDDSVSLQSDTPSTPPTPVKSSVSQTPTRRSAKSKLKAMSRSVPRGLSSASPIPPAFHASFQSLNVTPPLYTKQRRQSEEIAFTSPKQLRRSRTGSFRGTLNASVHSIVSEMSASESLIGKGLSDDDGSDDDVLAFGGDEEDGDVVKAETPKPVALERSSSVANFTKKRVSAKLRPRSHSDMSKQSAMKQISSEEKHCLVLKKLSSARKSTTNIPTMFQNFDSPALAATRRNVSKESSDSTVPTVTSTQCDSPASGSSCDENDEGVAVIDVHKISTIVETMDMVSSPSTIDMQSPASSIALNNIDDDDEHADKGNNGSRRSVRQLIKQVSERSLGSTTSKPVSNFPSVLRSPSIQARAKIFSGTSTIGAKVSTSAPSKRRSMPTTSAAAPKSRAPKRASMPTRKLQSVLRPRASLRFSNRPANDEASICTAATSSSSSVTFSEKIETFAIQKESCPDLLDAMFYTDEELANFRYESFCEELGLDPSQFDD